MSNDNPKSTAKVRGEKFGLKYGVAPLQIYKGDPGPEKLQIPPPNHPLFDPSSPSTFDELKVRQIDKDGRCTNIVEVWTDPDKKILWVLDGRETLLNIREVNRRRTAEGREPVLLRLQNVDGDEQQAVEHISVRNFHRRIPKPSAYALNIQIQRRNGQPWERICQILLVDTDDAEQWCRKRLPLAFCVKEVRDAFDAGEFPLSKVPDFAGRAVDGSDALGAEEQLALLEQKRGEKQEAKDAPKVPSVTPKVRERIRHALSNGATKNMTHNDTILAEGIAAALAFVNGDTAAFKRWPDIDAAVSEAVLKKSKKPKKPKKPKQAEDEDQADETDGDEQTT